MDRTCHSRVCRADRLGARARESHGEHGADREPPAEGPEAEGPKAEGPEAEGPEQREGAVASMEHPEGEL